VIEIPPPGGDYAPVVESVELVDDDLGVAYNMDSYGFVPNQISLPFSCSIPLPLSGELFGFLITACRLGFVGAIS
jgi:hypothetical protein